MEPDLLRSRGGHSHAKVTYIELFFDLVFVFAITQVSHTLMHHFDALGLVRAFLMMLAVWWVWIYTSWVTNWLDPEKLPVRIALLAMMLLGLILSASLPHAFDSRGLAFAGAYVAMQVGRSVFSMWATRGDAARVRNFLRIAIWLGCSGVFWIAGGLTHESTRLALWAVALLIELASPWAYFWVPRLGRSTSDDWDVEGAHMAERCALFVIIALGESILVTGATFSDLEWTPAVVAAFGISLVGSIAMWWLYFDMSAEAGTRRIVESSTPGKVARLAYTYIHLFMVAGIILAAVSDEFVLHHPLGHTDTKTAVSVLCSVALYLIGNMLFKWVVARKFPTSHLLGVGALALLGPFAHALSPLLVSGAAAAVLVVIAAAERVLCRALMQEGSTTAVHV